LAQRLREILGPNAALRWGNFASAAVDEVARKRVYSSRSARGRGLPPESGHRELPDTPVLSRSERSTLIPLRLFLLVAKERALSTGRKHRILTNAATCDDSNKLGWKLQRVAAFVRTRYLPESETLASGWKPRILTNAATLGESFHICATLKPQGDQKRPTQKGGRPWKIGVRLIERLLSLAGSAIAHR
jgi:hypothetical protein